MKSSIVVGLLFVVAGVPAAEQATFLTSAANVRLRSAPDPDTQVIQMLPLGTRLYASAPEQAAGWLPVRVQRDGPQGWISASLAVPVTEATYLEVASQLIESRLARHGDGFGAQRELLDLVETLLEREWPAEEKARLEFQRLQALQRVLRSIPWRRDLWDESLRTWIQQRQGEIRYNEPGGHWLIRPELILATHAAHQSAQVSDEIAWLAVQGGLGGECEGHLVCYLQRLDVLETEYLRREPDGRHVEEVVAHLVDRIESFIAGTEGPSRYHFNPDTECAGLAGEIATLTGAVLSSSSSQGVVLVDKANELIVQRCPEYSGAGR